MFFQHSEGSRTIPLKEGEVNVITIEVTAENGTAQKYIVNVKRLSAKDATLTNIKVIPGSLVPDFGVEIFDYNGTLIYPVGCQANCTIESFQELKFQKHIVAITFFFYGSLIKT